MATAMTPAPASSINAAIPTNGEAGPPVSGRLPPAAEAAEEVVVPLAVAVAVAVAVGVADAVADGVADGELGIPSPIALR